MAKKGVSRSDEALKKQGKRLKTLTKEKKISNRKLAELIDRDVSMIGFYRAGTRPLPIDLAKKIAQYLEVVPEYLTGETDAVTWEEYANAQETAAYNSTDEESEREYLQITRRKNLFAACGYLYECQGMASYDFAGIAPGTTTPPAPHRITALDGSGDATYFSNDEIEMLISELQDKIAFTCWKKSQQNK